MRGGWPEKGEPVRVWRGRVPVPHLSPKCLSLVLTVHNVLLDLKGLRISGPLKYNTSFAGRGLCPHVPRARLRPPSFSSQNNPPLDTTWLRTQFPLNLSPTFSLPFSQSPFSGLILAPLSITPSRSFTHQDGLQSGSCQFLDSIQTSTLHSDQTRY